MTQEMTQVNVRMSGSLKGAGDNTFAEASLNPSDARALKLAAFNQSEYAFGDAVRHYGIQIDPHSFKPMTEEEVEEAFYQNHLAEGAR